jgi:succinyl-CoA synthetase alpha subunit
MDFQTKTGCLSHGKETAPAGRTMGHAGAIVGGKDDTAAAKMAIMKECGLIVVDSPAEIGITMANALSGKMA